MKKTITFFIFNDIQKINLNKILLSLITSILIFFSIKNNIVCECSFLNQARYRLYLLDTYPKCYVLEGTDKINAQNFLNELRFKKNLEMSIKHFYLGKYLSECLDYNSGLRHPQLFYNNEYILDMMKNNYLYNYSLSSQLSSHQTNKRLMVFLSDINLKGDRITQLISNEFNLINKNFIDSIIFENNEFLINNYNQIKNDFFDKLK